MGRFVTHAGVPIYWELATRYKRSADRMAIMYRVLMPVDTDADRAIGQAEFVVALPAANESIHTIVLFVFHGEGDELPEELHGFESATRIRSVRRASEFFDHHGVDHTVIEESGDTAADIIADAETHDVNAIVLGSRKRSPVGKALFGSVTQSVLRNTSRPVVVTGSKSKARDDH